MTSAGASLYSFEKRLRDSVGLQAGAYVLASGLAELLQLSDVYVALPSKTGRIKVAASLNHPVVQGASVAVQWVQRLLRKSRPGFQAIDMADLPDPGEASPAWSSHLFVLECHHKGWPVPTSCIVGFRAAALNESEQLILQHLEQVWNQFYLAQRALTQAPWKRLTAQSKRQVVLLALAIGLPLSLYKTHMSIVAPLEIESSQTSVVAPLFAGVVEQILVRSNQPVTQGQVLATIDAQSLVNERLIQSLELEQLAAERITLQNQGFNDPNVSVRFVTLEREQALLQAQLDYLDLQIAETQIVAQRDGVVQFDEQSDVERRPVDAGQELMRIISPHKLRAQIYLPANDLIPLDTTHPIVASLDKSLLNSTELAIQFVRPQPVVHETLGLVYELYAQVPTEMAGQTIQLGDLGKARVYGPEATLGYQILRRPLLTLRSLFL